MPVMVLKWERIRAGSYRTEDGRFTISRVNRGRCFPIQWIVVDNQLKLQADRPTLAKAKDVAAVWGNPDTVFED